MNTTSLRAHACALPLVLCLAWPASAQDWDRLRDDPIDGPARFDISASAGFLMPTDWSDLVVLGTISPAFGVLEQVLVQNVRVEPDSKFAVNATYWRGRYGFRTEVGYSRSQLTIGGLPFGPEQDAVAVRTWTYGVRGAIALVDYTPRRWFWPYGFGGIGGITYDLSRPVAPPLLTIVQQGGPGGGQPGLIIGEHGREFVLGINQLDLETKLAVSYGLGMDFELPTGPAGIGVRLELSDTVARSPVRVHIREVGVPGSTDVGLGRVHHLRATAGVLLRFGR